MNIDYVVEARRRVPAGKHHPRAISPHLHRKAEPKTMTSPAQRHMMRVSAFFAAQREQVPLRHATAYEQMLVAGR